VNQRPLIGLGSTSEALADSRVRTAEIAPLTWRGTHTAARDGLGGLRRARARVLCEGQRSYPRYLACPLSWEVSNRGRGSVRTDVISCHECHISSALSPHHTPCRCRQDHFCDRSPVALSASSDFWPSNFQIPTSNPHTWN
jgi:hypothetical protein